MDAEGIRNSLKVHRAMRNLTQADLAELAGVTRKSVNAIETGSMVPSVLLALKLARALGVPVDTLFSLEGSATTATLSWDSRTATNTNEGGS
ncbi:MAG: helix-turn-helix transcriptional regulator [Thermoanaerobaculia bacterium]